MASIRDFAGCLATVSGGRHSGKTSALVGRAIALADARSPVAVVCATASAARAFGEAVLRLSAPASGLVRATTWTGLALDIRDRLGRPERRLIGLDAHNRRVADLLAAEKSAGSWTQHWPSLHPTLTSVVRQREIATGVLDLQRSWLGHDEIVTHADAIGCAPRWSELARFTERYRAWLDHLGEIDPAELLVDAGLALRTGEGAAEYRRHCPHLLVDDFERADYACSRLLTMLTAPTLRATGSVVVAFNPDGARWRAPDATPHIVTLSRRLAADAEIDLGRGVPDEPLADTSRRRVSPTIAAPRPTGVTRSLARAHHRGLEADAVIGAVIDAHAAGTAWERVAVVLPPTGGDDVSSALRRVARRLGVPMAAMTIAGDDPTVRAFAGVAAWLTDDDAGHLAAASSMGMVTGPDDPRLTDTPRHAQSSAAVHAAWRALAPWLLANADEAALDLVTAFVNRAGADHADIEDGLAARVTSPGIVTVVAPRDIAGRRWDTVVITRCVDGVWPARGAAGERFFDSALLEGPDVGESSERNRQDALEWRRRFDELVACAGENVIAVAAPEPGVLLSRFVEGWAPRPVVLHRTPQRAPTGPVPLTLGDAPAFPTRRLRLSATQLDTYENCPLNYEFQYVAGIRGEGSVSASVGTIVHAALETFLRGTDRSLDALMAALESHWEPTAFPYRPQAADYRMRADGWLQRWWADELPRIAEVIAVEHRFSIEVGPHELTGSIDRVSRDTDGLLEIVDYKTGTAPSGRIDETNLQLATYHLAATRDPVIAAHGAPDRLRLHYLDSGGAGQEPRTGKDIDQPITADHIERTEARILSTAEAILDERFEASVDASCDYCSFHRLCPLQAEGREVPGS